MTKNDFPALIIFIRNPELGKGKTRLAAKIGKEKAFKVYLELLKLTRELALIYPGQSYIFYSEFIDKNDEWENNFFTKKVQIGSDLGQKMENAFNEVLKLHKSAMIIGSDCPYIEPVDLRNAAIALIKNDLVLGPAEDGGYYLLGLKQAHSFLFENISWSSSTVLNDTIQVAEKNQLEIHRMRELNDIDELEDWEEYLSFLKKNKQL